MKRALLDTNIYGLIVEKKEENEFRTLVNRAQVIIYGCSIIRKELRDTPKNKRRLTEKGISSLRIGLLNLYDAITTKHELLIDKKTQELANKYLKKFSEITGQTALDHLKIDFLLVACATLNNLDLVVSEDHKTLLSTDATRAYHFVNGSEGLHIPPLFTYEDLKLLIKRSFLS